jgi:hypothetical protein
VSIQQIGRRELLKVIGGGAAGIIVGYSPQAKAWVTGQGPHHQPFECVPRLDGELLTDEASRLARGTDLGNIVFNTPAAVLRPESIDDVVSPNNVFARRGTSCSNRSRPSVSVFLTRSAR